MSTRIEIPTAWLKLKLLSLEQLHSNELMQGRPPELHHGIVPDLICEILKLRGEEVSELPYPHFSEFIKNES